MRTRNLLASVLLLAAVGFVALAPAAGAQEGDDEQLSEETEECIHLAEEADDPDACQEAPSPILPATDELIWGGISFVVLFFLLRKFAYPQIIQGMEARSERIRGDLQAAQQERDEADGVLAEYRAQLNDARSEAGRIIEEARRTADEMKRDHEARLQAELAELRERAVADIEAAKTRAMSDLRGEVADLAIQAAEVVVQRNLDKKTQTQLVEEYINQLAARSS